jgi:hypothetical protein
MGVSENRILVGFRTYFSPALLSLCTFFLGKFLIQQEEYNKAVRDTQTQVVQLNERLTNFMGYYEETKMAQKESFGELKANIQQIKEDNNRFYTEYLPYVKFEYNIKPKH